MIKHLLKLVWNRKRANALIVAEIFISFLVLFAVLAASITFAARWNEPRRRAQSFTSQFSSALYEDEPRESLLRPVSWFSNCAQE